MVGLIFVGLDALSLSLLNAVVTTTDEKIDGKIIMSISLPPLAVANIDPLGGGVISFYCSLFRDSRERKCPTGSHIKKGKKNWLFTVPVLV